MFFLFWNTWSNILRTSAVSSTKFRVNTHLCQLRPVGTVFAIYILDVGEFFLDGRGPNILFQNIYLVFTYYKEKNKDVSREFDEFWVNKYSYFQAALLVLVIYYIGEIFIRSSVL